MASNLKRLSQIRRTPIPGPRIRGDRKIDPGISESEVKAILINNPRVFDSFVLECVSQDRLEQLLAVKKDKPVIAGIPEASFPVHEVYLGESVRDIAQNLVLSTSDPERLTRLTEVSEILARSLNANSVTVYVLGNDDQEVIALRNGREVSCGPVGYKMTVAAHAAVEKKILIIDDIRMDKRFPKGISPSVITDCRVMCIPVELPSGDMLAIIEFTRDHFKTSFGQIDLQLVNLVLSWTSGCMYESELKAMLTQQESLNDFLLQTTKEIFDEMTCLDTVVQKVMMFTKKLVKAESCALFLVDEDRNELCMEYFDLAAPEDGKKSKQIRFPADKGIAGHVARTGKVVNIHNAYDDPRFDPAIDEQTGYKTRNVLCMPIVNKTRIIGVVQMINSTNSDHFTHSDELAFNTFAVYCALALNFSQVYSMLRLQQNQYTVAMEVLQYHIVCSEEEIQQLRENPYIDVNDLPPLFTCYEFCVYDCKELIPKLFIHMVLETFGKSQFEIEKLCSFILTVKKNYRPVTYHNFEHGFHVSHSLWCMLNKTGDLFSDFEKMALVIAGICHDIDHRGYNNAFFEKLGHPLADLYSTSVMEQHHYKQAVAILQMEGQAIFSFLDHEKYKEMLELIRHHILATDLALYFENQKTLSSFLDDGSFSLADDSMRMRAKALMMTAADLCAISKPWETQTVTVEKLYDEFYMQGDEERKRGFDPLPIMDRNTKDDQPKQQIGFINFICIPLYTTLFRIFPETEPLLEDCKKNRSMWEHRVQVQ